MSNRHMPDALDLEPFWWIESPAPDRTPGPESDLFLCTHCSTLKESSAFPPSASKPRPSGGPACAWCSSCRYQDRLKYESDHPDPLRYRQKALSRYGLTVKAFEAMLAAQDGRCLLCDTVPPPQASGRSPFHVDHDKRTGTVRGLLCQSCNVILGMVDDDPERLMHIAAASVDYLATALGLAP